MKIISNFEGGKFKRLTLSTPASKEIKAQFIKNTTFSTSTTFSVENKYKNYLLN